MTNWKTFKIIDKGRVSSFSCSLNIQRFWLDDYVEYRDKRENKIIVEDLYSAFFNDWKEGDYIEVDVEKIQSKYEHNTPISDESIVKKIYSVNSSSFTNMTIGSTTITREHSLAVARTLDAMVDQSGGSKEYTASIEVQDNQGKPIKFSISSKKAN